MKKLIIVIFILLGISSCQDNIATTSNNVEYKITDIEVHLQDTSLCRYKGSTDTGNHIYFQDKIYFLDSIGKYNIGDKVQAEFIKK